MTRCAVGVVVTRDAEMKMWSSFRKCTTLTASSQASPHPAHPEPNDRFATNHGASLVLLASIAFACHRRSRSAYRFQRQRWKGALAKVLAVHPFEHSFRPICCTQRACSTS